MFYYKFIVNSFIKYDQDEFIYHSKNKLIKGQVVSLQVKNKPKIGIVQSSTDKPAFETKPINSLIVESPIPAQQIELLYWISSYYMTHLSKVMPLFIPKGILKKRRIIQEKKIIHTRKLINIDLNIDQQLAIKKIVNSKDRTILLHGITGSGKTEVYIYLAKNALKKNLSTLLLVPEIALTSQLYDEIAQRLPNVIVIHSKQSESKKHLIWNTVLRSEKPFIIIGPRSAIFLPLKYIGYIIIDEAHDPSYKQDLSPKYYTLRVASKLAEFHDAKMILGSATPPINEYYMAKKYNKSIVCLNKPARKILKPDIKIIDIKKRSNFKENRIFSDYFLDKMNQALNNNQQVLIYHNRRGSTNITMCENCGWSAGCPKCFMPLTLHADNFKLQCHVCEYRKKIDLICPKCKRANIIHKGIGTKLLEKELINMYPNKSIARFDADNDINSGLDKKYSEVYKGLINIIIGTQTIAKGLDLPLLSMVGIVHADLGLGLPDYASSERTFQLISQVIGRVGRNENKTNIVVQAYQYDNPAITLGINQDYINFFQYSIKERSKLHFPPFCFLLKLTCTYRSEKLAIHNAIDLKSKIIENSPNFIEVLGPTPSFYERYNGQYRWQIILKSPIRSVLQDIVKLIPKNNWQFELDPISLI